MLKKIIIAKYYGFCMGVKRAINIAEKTAQQKTGRVTILNEIVHNEAVVEQFRRKNVGQAFSVDEVEDGTLIISAHGVSPDVKQKAQAKGLEIIDATCPLVSRIYNIINSLVQNGYRVIHYGDATHDETRGIVGHAPESIFVFGDISDLERFPSWEDTKLGLTVQTTAELTKFLEIEKAARKKWPHIEVFNTICNATTQRQTAIMELAPQVDMILVVGSSLSANSKRLVKISEALCGRGKLIASAQDIEEDWLEENRDVESIGISAGASTPDFLVESIIRKLVELSNGTAEVVIPEQNRKLQNTLLLSEEKVASVLRENKSS